MGCTCEHACYRHVETSCRDMAHTTPLSINPAMPSQEKILVELTKCRANPSLCGCRGTVDDGLTKAPERLGSSTYSSATKKRRYSPVESLRAPSTSNRGKSPMHESQPTTGSSLDGAMTYVVQPTAGMGWYPTVPPVHKSVQLPEEHQHAYE